MLTDAELIGRVCRYAGYWEQSEAKAGGFASGRRSLAYWEKSGCRVKQNNGMTAVRQRRADGRAWAGRKALFVWT
jgi:hypothetical protein